MLVKYAASRQSCLINTLSNHKNYPYGRCPYPQLQCDSQVLELLNVKHGLLAMLFRSHKERSLPC